MIPAGASSLPPTERVVLLGADRSLVGIVTAPPAAGMAVHDVGALILNAGMVHHAGPHRLHVLLARRLAAHGVPAVRFDFSGIGDSPVRRDNLPLEQSSPREVREVMDQLQRDHGLTRFLLLGLCSGAAAAFKVACEDARVAGAVLINPRSFDTSRELDDHITERGLARYYFTIAARDPRRWWRLVTGRGRYRRIAGALISPLKDFQRRARLLRQESGRLAGEIRRVTSEGRSLLFLFSEGDAGLAHLQLIFGESAGDLVAGAAPKVVIPRCDHTFTLARARAELLRVIDRWIAAIVREGDPQRLASEEAPADARDERERGGAAGDARRGERKEFVVG